MTHYRFLRQKITKKSAQNVVLVVPHNAPHVLLGFIARAQKFEACYELTHIRLLASVVLPLQN